MKQEYKGKATDNVNVPILPSFVLDPYFKNLRSYPIEQTLVTVLGEKFGVAQRTRRAKVTQQGNCFIYLFIFFAKGICVQNPNQASEHMWPRWSLSFIADVGGDCISFHYAWLHNLALLANRCKEECEGGSSGNMGPC